MHSLTDMIMISLHDFVVLVDWIILLFLVKFLIMLSVVTINRLRLVSLVTTKHILIDFSINGLFDRHLLCLFCLTQRRINNNHPKNIQKYINTMYNYSQKLILLKQACECQHKLYFSSKKAESIDETLTAVRLAVEKKCHVSHYLP